MKKNLSLALLGLALSANAQQVNGSFDDTWEKCYPWSSTTNYDSNKEDVGTQPVGWKVSNVYNRVMPSTVATETTDSDGNKAVLLTNQEVAGQKIPAYISLGTPWSTASVKGITVQNGTADGGVWGGISFTYKPDAVQLKYKRTLTTGSTERASVIAYLWKGTWTQTDVPANVAVGTIFSAGTPKKVDMTDRDRNVLFNKSGVVGGAITSTEDATLIASKEYYITDATNEWTTLTIDLDYKSDETPEKLNIILSANDFFADRSGITANNTLTVDDVKLIYRSQISSINVNGVAIEGFSKDEYKYVIKGACPASENAFTTVLTGKNATIAWTKSENIYTATVTNVDKDENGATSHTYTFEFVDLGISSISYNGMVNYVTSPEQHYFVFSGDDISKENDLLTIETNDPSANVTQSLDKASRIITVTVSKYGLEDKFYVKIAHENVVKYIDKMYIALINRIIGISTRGVGEVSAVEVSQPENPEDSSVEGKVVDFQLKNFEFMGGNLGDIYVTQVPYNIQEDGSVLLQKDAIITIFGDAGITLGELPVNLEAKIENGVLNGTINITWERKPIKVDLYSLNATYVDLSTYDLGESTLEEIKNDFDNSNCLFYLSKSTGMSGNNIICGSTCDNFTLTEGQAFDAPKAFTATKVTYNRTLTAGNVQTFVLPFSFTPGKNDVVAALESVDGSVLTFKRIEGATEANKPYLIQTDNANALASFDNVTIEQTTGDLTTTVNGVSHIGSYAELTVTGAYGYTGGQFVKAGKGTVKPFRTYITIPAGSAAAPKAFDIHFADTETGIATVVTDSKDQNVYNLQGVRVAKSLNGLPKGIYIVNGKKTVIK